MKVLTEGWQKLKFPGKDESLILWKNVLKSTKSGKMIQTSNFVALAKGYGLLQICGGTTLRTEGGIFPILRPHIIPKQIILGTCHE